MFPGQVYRKAKKFVLFRFFLFVLVFLCEEKV